MKVAELRNKTYVDLMNELDKSKKALLNLRFQVSNGQVENIYKAKYLRKTIARIKTILRENELKGSK